jgi:hydrogenase expression/formation protein HypE
MIRAERVVLAHGAGGKMSQQLTEEVFLPHLNDPALLALNDQALLDLPPGRIAFSTDTYVVTPVFFPGGDIGSLAVHGTVNDVAVSGATPLAMSVGFILEEGLLLADLERIVRSMAGAAKDAGVRIVTADTKVVAKGAADGIFINTTGIGVVDPARAVTGHGGRAGDRILLSGTLGDHGIAVASSRSGIALTTPVLSDSAPLAGLIARVREKAGDSVHAMRDPTRGGFATVMVELASQSGVGVEIDENALPVREAVRGACELLGYDPLYLANEGKVAMFVAPERAQAALTAMRSHPFGREAAIVGEVVAAHPGKVILRTAIGGRRWVDRLAGDMLPRIC